MTGVTIAQIGDNVTIVQGVEAAGPPGVGGGVTDHGALTGLGDDDHPQYHNDARGDARYQPLDSDLTAIAALSTTSFGRGLLALADAAALRSSAGLVIGTDIYSKAAIDSGFQPLDSDLTAIAALSTTTFGRGLLALADAAAARTALGLGSLATVTPTGTPDGTKFLRDDHTWAAAGGGGGGGGLPSIDGKPGSPNADNHEFASSLGSFVAVAGSAGTVGLTSASADGVYQFVDGRLLAYPNNGSQVWLRFDRTLADGESVVGKFLYPRSSSGLLGFVLNDDDTTPHNAVSSSRISLWADSTGPRTVSYDAGSTVAVHSLHVPGSALYLRVARVGTNYHLFVSLDGEAWDYMGVVASSTAPNNIWLYFRQDSNVGIPAQGITGIDWLRFGGNDVHPWTYTATP